MTPAVTLTGTLKTVAGDPAAGSVLVIQINYGANQPEVSDGACIVSEVAQRV